MSAYVEIIFDNSDERFPTGKNEVILRRTIGLKKDEYTLDRKNATKTDVMNLLESAGFSRSNPYYIVPQGRVTALTNMKDPERLNLLKEVAGTQVYEARRAESLKIMQDTDNKRQKIDDLMAYIKDRLDELEEEKEELRAYQDKDKERRCLEYTIYSREQQEIAKALESLDELRQTGIDETDENSERFIEGEKELSQVDAEINELNQQLEFLKLDKKQMEDERKEAAREGAKLELEVKGLSDRQSAAQQARQRNEGQLEEVQGAIQLREEELVQVIPQYTIIKEQEGALKSQLADAESSRQRLYAKQGRNAQFKTKAERDVWLRREIDEVNVALATRKAVTMQTTEEITVIEKEIGTLHTEVADRRARLDNRGETTESMAASAQTARAERDKLQDERK